MYDKNSIYNAFPETFNESITRQPSRASIELYRPTLSSQTSKKLSRDSKTINEMSSNLRNLDQIEKERIPIEIDESDSTINEKFYGIVKNEDLVQYELKDQLFKDDNFTPIMAFPDYRKFLEEKKRSGKLVWVRPHQISNDPKFSATRGSKVNKSNLTRDDIMQGEFNNCWFLATLSAVSIHQEFINRIAPKPEDQTFNHKKGYNGKFNFNFYYYGEWIQVTIDDRLPCVLYPDGQFRLIGCKSSDENEFWSALLEKAYAKFNGGYHVLSDVGGNSNQAMIDLTGGAVEERLISREISRRNDKNFTLLFSHIENMMNVRVLLNCSIQGQPGTGAFEVERSDGLFSGHAYCITGTMRIPLDKTCKESLAIRLRNPWGCSIWTGLKDAISTKNYQKWEQAIKNSEQDDFVEGEFWMPFYKFIEIFTNINICRLNMNHYKAEGCWNEISYVNGKWSESDKTAGGLEKIVENPYIAAELSGGKMSDQMIMIMQHVFTRKMKIDAIASIASKSSIVSQIYNPIGFLIYKMKSSSGLDTNLQIVQPTLSQVLSTRKDKNGHPKPRNRDKVFGELMVARDFCKTVKNVEKGRYAIIPVCVKSGNDRKGNEGEFIMRVYVESE